MDSIINIHDFKNRIMESDIVSFDVFDTLLLRNVLNPTDIFKIVENEYSEMNGVSEAFHSIRIKAEEAARRKHNHEDITFDEIYECVEKEVGSAAKEYQRLEIEIEKQFLIANTDMLNIYNFAKQLGKKIYIISDMYLPCEILDDILKLNGFSGFDKLFVSGELRVTKATGSMYSYIKSVERIGDESKWLHVGDNYQSDIVNAAAHGIKTYYYEKLSDRESTHHTTSISDSILRAIQINEKYLTNNRPYWFGFGADFAAPIFIGLMNWLEQQLVDKDNIYFLARDGHLPYKLYNLLEKINPRLPKGSYLYASRRAYVFPYLLFEDQKVAIETLLLFNVGLNQELTLKEVLVNLDLDTDLYSDQLGKFGIQSFDEIITDKNRTNFLNFLHSIWPDIQAVFKQELEILKEYLKESGISDKDSINIFDVGWSGSTHVALKQILNKNIHGYYFGTLESLHFKVRDTSLAYAFHLGTPRRIRNLIMEQIMIYELIFSAPEGTLIKFEVDDNNDIKPRLVEVEQNAEMYSIINKIHEGVFHIFERTLPYRKYMSEVSLNSSLGRMHEFTSSYRASDVLHFSKLTNAIGFGHSQDVKNYVTVVTINQYLKDRKFINKNAKYNLWKNAILIKDEQGRYFNRQEIEKLYNIRRSFVSIDVGRLLSLFIKAVKNPKKAIRKVLILIKSR